MPFTTKIVCPIKSDCPWRGYISQTPAHCKEAHPSNYLTNTCLEMDAKKNEGTQIFLHMKNEIVFVIIVTFKKGNLKVKFKCLFFDLWVDNTTYTMSLHKLGKRKMFERYTGNIQANSEVCLKVKHSVFDIRIDLTVMPPLLLYLDTSREKVICGFCKQVMAKPIYQCHTGAHIMCGNCAGFKKYCRICKVFTTMDNLPILENLALMFQASCMQTKFGCEFQGSIIDVRIHEAECVYRQFHCTLCNWTCSVDNFSDHLKFKHMETPYSLTYQMMLNLPNSDSTAIIFKYGIVVLISFKYHDGIQRSLNIKLIGPAGLEPYFNLTVKTGDNSEILERLNGRRYSHLLYTYSIQESVESVLVELHKQV